MKLNHEQLKAMFERNPSLRKANETNPTLGGKLLPAEPEHYQTKPLVKAVQGETKSAPRTVVRITGHRIQLLDPDNFAGSTKDLLDGLRHAGLLSDDSLEFIKLETEQFRVHSRKEECTVIEIGEE